MTHPTNTVKKPFCKTVRLMKKISASNCVTTDKGAKDGDLKRKTNENYLAAVLLVCYSDVSMTSENLHFVLPPTRSQFCF